MPKRIEVHFWKRLRAEKKFSGPDELRAQIAQRHRQRRSIFLEISRASVRDATNARFARKRNTH